MSLWHPALSTTLSISNKWPQLHYIHQDMQTGEFAASDNRILLVENNGTPPLAEWWNPDGTVADVQGLEYVKYSELRNLEETETLRLYGGVYQGHDGYYYLSKVLLKL